MAIYRMIRQSVFELEAIERMTAAYEHALKVLQLADRNDPKPNWSPVKLLRSRKWEKPILTGFADEPSKHSGWGRGTELPDWTAFIFAGMVIVTMVALWRSR